MKYIYLLILIFVIIYKTQSKENFYGMNYIQQHAYFKCCSELGCGHPTCRNYLQHTSSPLNLIGFIFEKANSNGNIYKLYSRINQNSNREEYFLKHYNTNDDYIMKRINANYLYNGDELNYNNKIYEVSLYENNGLPIYNSNPHYHKNYNWLYNNLHNRFQTENLYANTVRKVGDYNYIPSNSVKHGYIYDENNNNDYMLLYKKNIGRNRWKYYVKKEDILIPLKEYENKDIYENDKLNLPFNSITYTFNELDN